VRAAAVENLRKVLPFLDKGNDEEIPLALTQIALAETQEEEEEEEREDVEDDGDDGDGGEPLKKKRDEGDDDVVVERDVLPPLLLLTLLPTTTVRVAARAQNVFMRLRVSARVLLLLSRMCSQRFSIQHHTSFFFEEDYGYSSSLFFGWDKNVKKRNNKWGEFKNSFLDSH
tara:strand:- start:362 stop:874 length:513 start_codon:yes stop_codon:yes gene_type:complete